LALIPAIKESSHFKQFIGIDEHFPEFCNDYSGTGADQSPTALFEGRSHSISGLAPVNSGVFAFKLMNDLLGNSNPSTTNLNTR
jgi:hypothetical protein